MANYWICILPGGCQNAMKLLQSWA